MTILILGANGLIGSAVTRGLIRQGHAVTAMARSVEKPRRCMPRAAWVEADLRWLSSPEDWLPLLHGVTTVINCAGVLQNGFGDDVIAVQQVAMQALYEAAQPATLIIQISARADGPAGQTPFLASKRSADEALSHSGLPSVILRPAIVVGSHAYGGTALLRALAAMPIVSLLANPQTELRFAALDDVVAAVQDAVSGKIAPGLIVEIAGPKRHTLAEAAARHREWLGLPPNRTIAVPLWGTRAAAAVADALGRLGWRSPLRSTATQTATAGIVADPQSNGWQNLDDILQSHPAGVADLWFARLYLLKPVVFGVLSLFWIASGLIALAAFNASAAHFRMAGFSDAAANTITVATSLLDIILGALVLVRRHSGLALKSMIGVSLAYLASATMATPAMWLDPLGPLVKVLPAIVLALVALAILDDR